MIAAQLFTLAGVALGALSSYVISFRGERVRHRRELAKGWDERKFDCFVVYVNDVKEMGVLARRIAASQGLHVRAPDELDPEIGLPRLADAEGRRSISMERMRLLSDVDTIAAASHLNNAAWRLEWLVRGKIDGADADDWAAAQHAFEAALDEFHRCARRELGVPGQLGFRRFDPVPSREALTGE